MSRKLASIQKIKKISTIPNADKIEVATVNDWKVVVEKNKFKSGDLVIFFEIDSLLPIIPEYDFLLKGSKPKKMLNEGLEITGIRLKTIRLRGQISQGFASTDNLKDYSHASKLMRPEGFALAPQQKFLFH